MMSAYITFTGSPTVPIGGHAVNFNYRFSMKKLRKQGNAHLQQ